jgi:heparin binding hemagglutinin HbhA
MANTKQQSKFDATRPFYAAVGAGDLAVALARNAANDVQARFTKVDLEPKAVGNELSKGVKDAQARFEARVAEIQADAKEFSAKVEARLAAARSELNESIEDLNKQYAELAARGRSLVTRIRRQQATQDLQAEAAKTATKAKTTRTQAAGAASTAKRSAKATGTSAKQTAKAGTKAASDAAAKTGK